LGARKIAIINVGPLGCIPSQLASNNVQNGQCIEYINGYVRGFNAATVLLVNRLSAQLPGSKFVIGNAYDIVADKIANPANYGDFSSISVLMASENECLEYATSILSIVLGSHAD
jgi:hypothetical protein